MLEIYKNITSIGYECVLLDSINSEKVLDDTKHAIKLWKKTIRLKPPRNIKVGIRNGANVYVIGDNDVDNPVCTIDDISEIKLDNEILQDYFTRTKRKEEMAIVDTLNSEIPDHVKDSIITWKNRLEEMLTEGTYLFVSNDDDEFNHKLIPYGPEIIEIKN